MRTAVLQQCRRPEILSSLPPHIQQIAQKIDQWKFRIYVARFAKGQGVDPRLRNSPRILAMKKHYESTKEKDQSWSEYWDSLIKKRQWVCKIFVECTALLLQHDIHIISTSSTPDQPWLVISGNIEDPNVPCEGLPLLIGSKTDIHYQSLLPAPLQPVRTPSSQPESRQAGRGSSPSPSPPQKRSRQSLVQSQSEQAVSQAESSQCLSPSQAEEEIFKRPESLPPNFTFEFEQFSIEFPCKSADFLMECPLCKTRTKYIVNHIVKKVECQKNINPLHFEYQFKKYKANQLAEKRKLSNQARQAAFKARQRVHQSFNHLK